MFETLFTNIEVAGVPLLFVTLGLVQAIKDAAKLEGSPVRVLSLVIGLLLGFGYQFSAGPLVGFEGYFSAIIFGLGLGVTASGSYDTARAAVASGYIRAQYLMQRSATVPQEKEKTYK